MLIVRGIMWISVLIVMLICMVKTKRNGMKKKIRALIFVVFLFILFVFMPYSTEAPIENLFITFKTPEQAIHYINAPFSNDKIEDIIVGQDTCMSVFKSGQDEELYAGRDMWLRKGEKGYKLISAAGVQKAILSNDIRDEDLDIFFYVDYIKGTKDTYFTGTCETMGKLTLKDNAGTHFTVRLMDSSFLGTDQKRYYCYGCVKDMQDDYQINEVVEIEELMEIKQLIQRQKIERMMKVHKEMRGLDRYREQPKEYKYHNPYDDWIFRQLADIDNRKNIPNTSPQVDFNEGDYEDYLKAKWNRGL